MEQRKVRKIDTIKHKTPYEIIAEGSTRLVLLDGQEKARVEVATTLSNFLTYLKGLDSGLTSFDLPAFSMLAFGGTGSGKSHLFKMLARACGLQVITIDGASLSAPSYKGVNLTEAFSMAVKALKDPEAFCKIGGICIIDEIDKIADSGRMDGGGFSIQSSFLKLLEKDHVFQTNDGSFPTDRILFVFTGAFSKLQATLKAKHKKSSLGFIDVESTKEGDIDYLSMATMEDFAEYGILPELLGRIGRCMYIPPLTTEDYKMLLKGNQGNSIKKLYSNLLGVHGITFDITDEACNVIATKAKALGQGARALTPTVSKALEPAFSVIYDDESITSVTIAETEGELSLLYGREGVRAVNNTENGNDEVLP